MLLPGWYRWKAFEKETYYQGSILLPEDCELVPFEIHEESSSAYGYATTEVINEESGLETILDLLGPVVDDWTNESSDCTYALPSGKKVYIGCDFRTVMIGGEDD
jgi:hypothetical protein